MGGEDRRLVELIQSAVLAGAYSNLVRAHPDAGGLVKMYVKNDARVTALSNQVAGRAGTRLRYLWNG